MSLTMRQAEEIRRAYARDRRITHAMLAERYGVSPQTIWSVLSYRSHVPPTMRTVLVPLRKSVAKKAETQAEAVGMTLAEFIAAAIG